MAAAFAEHPGCIFVPEENSELARFASAYAARGGAAWVAEAGGAVVGSLAVAPTTVPARFELFKVYVAAAARGRGLAALMLEEARAFVAARGGCVLELFTDTRFHGGHRFYERQGFVRVPGERWLGAADGAWERHYVRAL
jgi:putative acetyltransferase